MENRKRSLRGRPLLILLVILLIVISAGVWAWRHFPSAPEDHNDPRIDSLKITR